MADKLREYSTAKLKTDQIGQATDDLMKQSQYARRNFERRWYDNNFFDDGYHFRYLSRTQNKIVDIAEKSNLYNPLRAVPKASRQIRGIANLLTSQNPTPIIYPEKVEKANYPDEQQQDPQTGQIVNVPNPEYQQALEIAKQTAKKAGHWVQEEMKNQEMLEKLALMTILTAKHGISYLQVWPDYINEVIKTQVYDAFDIYLNGEILELEDCPFIIKTCKKTVAEIKANELFDQEQVQKLSPDNRHASSDIKEAYMAARFGRGSNSDAVVSVIEKECFLKEYLNSDNMPRIRAQDDGEAILRNKKEGDVVIRQVFSVGNIWLRDKYTNLPEYPFVDFRLEPGPLYQVPLIERFIPQNKSYDMILSRLERILHTTQTGILIHQDGLKPTITNEAGAQMVGYTGVPPTWQSPAQVPAWVFNVLGIMQSNMEEQGVTTTTLGKLPTGVRANAAIESLKESEFANLTIATRRFRNTVKRIAEKFLDLADEYFITPQTVDLLEKGEPQYFDVIGNQAYEQRKALKINTEGLVPLKKGYHVDIEVENQLGYTQEGKKAAAKDLAEFMIQMAQLKMLPPEAVAAFVGEMLKTYEFGPTQELMEKVDAFIAQGGAGMDDQQIDKMKLAVLEVLKDAKGAGVFDQAEGQTEEKVQINYKDAPEDVKRQMEAGAGYKPSESISPAGTEQIVAQAEAQIKARQVNQKGTSDTEKNQITREKQAKEKEKTKK